MIKKRIEMWITQSQIAKQVGVAKSTVGNWEAKHCRRSGKVREQIIAWLGFDPEPK
jgi:DNA-binding XRE family transcriptional regulator